MLGFQVSCFVIVVKMFVLPPPSEFTRSTVWPSGHWFRSLALPRVAQVTPLTLARGDQTPRCQCILCRCEHKRGGGGGQSHDLWSECFPVCHDHLVVNMFAGGTIWIFNCITKVTPGFLCSVSEAPLVSARGLSCMYLSRVDSILCSPQAGAPPSKCCALPALSPPPPH